MQDRQVDLLTQDVPDPFSLGAIQRTIHAMTP